MKYAKLINDYPSYAPRKLRVGDTVVYNPLPEQLLAAGYLPVVETEPPEVEDGYYAEPHWAVVDGEIVQSWTVEVAEPTADELLDIIMGVAE